MSLVTALRWSRPFQARMLGICSLCCRDIYLGEEIQILATIDADDGSRTIVGHLSCMHLDTPAWRVDQFRSVAAAHETWLARELSGAKDDLAHAWERVGELEEQLARKSDVCEQLRGRLQSLRAAIHVVES